jgi:Spy/CpxP family protein refolding chaperone
MKLRSFLFAFAFLFVGIMAMAQPLQGMGQFNPEEMIKRQTEQMVKDLGLNDSQKTKIEALNKKYGAKMGEVFQSAGGDREKVREKMTAMRTEKDAELKTILTPEQFTKYQELEKKRMEERRQNGQGRPGGPGAPPQKRGQQRGSGDSD